MSYQALSLNIYERFLTKQVSKFPLGTKLGKSNSSFELGINLSVSDTSYIQINNILNSNITFWGTIYLQLKDLELHYLFIQIPYIALEVGTF